MESDKENVKKYARRSSILKTAKRISEEEELEIPENTMLSQPKRVSFAKRNSIKPFSIADDKNTIWDTTYEEKITSTMDSAELSNEPSTFIPQPEGSFVDLIRQRNLSVMLKSPSFEIDASEASKILRDPECINSFYMYSASATGINVSSNSKRNRSEVIITSPFISDEKSVSRLLLENKENLILPNNLPLIQAINANFQNKEKLKTSIEYSEMDFTCEAVNLISNKFEGISFVNNEEKLEVPLIMVENVDVQYPSNQTEGEKSMELTINNNVEISNNSLHSQIERPIKVMENVDVQCPSNQTEGEKSMELTINNNAEISNNLVQSQMEFTCQLPNNNESAMLVNKTTNFQESEMEFTCQTPIINTVQDVDFKNNDGKANLSASSMEITCPIPNSPEINRNLRNPSETYQILQTTNKQIEDMEITQTMDETKRKSFYNITRTIERNLSQNLNNSIALKHTDPLEDKCEIESKEYNLTGTGAIKKAQSNPIKDDKTSPSRIPILKDTGSAQKAKKKILYTEPAPMINLTEIKTPNISTTFGKISSPCIDDTQQLINVTFSQQFFFPDKSIGKSLITLPNEENQQEIELPKSFINNNSLSNLDEVRSEKYSTSDDSFGINNKLTKLNKINDTLALKKTEDYDKDLSQVSIELISSQIEEESDTIETSVTSTAKSSAISQVRASLAKLKDAIAQSPYKFRERKDNYKQNMEIIKQQHSEIVKKIQKVEIPKLKLLPDYNSSDEDENDSKDESITDLYKKIKELEARSENIWTLIDKSECNEIYTFTTFKDYLKLTIQCNWDDGLVYDFKIEDTKECFLPFICLMMKIFKDNFLKKCLESALGTKYDILSLLDYTSMTFRKMAPIRNELLDLNIKDVKYTGTYDNYILKYGFYLYDYLVSFVLEIDCTDLNNINEEHINITRTTGKVDIIGIKNLVHNCPKGVEFVRKYIDEILLFLDKTIGKQ